MVNNTCEGKKDDLMTKVILFNHMKKDAFQFKLVKFGTLL